MDDAPSNLHLLSDMLKRKGYRVRPARSGKTALSAASAEAPDLILLDILMPEMDGYEVCASLKAHPALADVPVIFLSALGDTFDKVKAFRVGGVDYITKPFQMEEVYARIETHLKMRRLQADLQVKNEELLKSQAQLRVLTGRILEKQDEERRERSQQLHDALSQQLVGLGLEAWELQRQTKEVGGAASPLLQKLLDRINQLATEAYAISQELHPAILDRLGLVSALEHECEEVSAREGVQVDCDFRDAPDTVPAPVALCLYRVVQEGLRNIVAHARAKAARVSLKLKDGGLLLTIGDDGAGMSPDRIQESGGLGLASLEHRMRLIRGKFGVKSEAGTGTTVEAWAPLPEAEVDAGRQGPRPPRQPRARPKK